MADSLFTLLLKPIKLSFLIQADLIGSGGKFVVKRSVDLSGQSRTVDNKAEFSIEIDGARIKVE